MVDAEAFPSASDIAIPHVADGELRELHARLRFELLGEVEKPLAIASVQMMKYLSDRAPCRGRS